MITNHRPLPDAVDAWLKDNTDDEPEVNEENGDGLPAEELNAHSLSRLLDRVKETATDLGMADAADVLGALSDAILRASPLRDFGPIPDTTPRDHGVFLMDLAKSARALHRAADPTVHQTRTGVVESVFRTVTDSLTLRRGCLLKAAYRCFICSELLAPMRAEDVIPAKAEAVFFPRYAWAHLACVDGRLREWVACMFLVHADKLRTACGLPVPKYENISELEACRQADYSALMAAFRDLRIPDEAKATPGPAAWLLDPADLAEPFVVEGLVALGASRPAVSSLLEARRKRLERGSKKVK